jgi:hypothetical protein
MTEGTEVVNTETDTDKLELLAEGFKDLTTVGEAIFEDGEVTFSDLDQVGPMKDAAMKIYKAAKAYKEMIGEAKDIDAVEAIKIVQILLA